LTALLLAHCHRSGGLGPHRLILPYPIRRPARCAGAALVALKDGAVVATIPLERPATVLGRRAPALPRAACAARLSRSQRCAHARVCSPAEAG
jgi:hypothetical protein